MTARTRTRLAALLATSLVALAGCGSDDDPEADDPNQPAPSSSQATDEPSSATASASDGGSPAQVAVPVYFAGRTPIGTRLFREFRNVEADDPVDEALALLGAGDVLDPDYSTLVPGQLRGQSQDELFLVELSDPGLATRPEGMGSKQAKLAVQQVVYTVQGVLQERIPIGFVLPSGDSTPFLGLDTPVGGFNAAPQNDVLAFVNVTEPAEGERVSGTFAASGVANSFEATVPWEVRDQSDKKVLQGFSTAEGWGDRLYPWESQVDVSSLAPGTYSFVAMTDDPSAGEGAGPTEDTKTIIVQ